VGNAIKKGIAVRKKDLPIFVLRNKKGAMDGHPALYSFDAAQALHVT